VRAANDEVVRLVAASDVLRAGIATVPLLNPDESIAELERAFASGLQGLTLHHRFAGKPLDTPIMWPILESLPPGTPVFVHCLYESAFEATWRLERLARDFPGLTFVALMGMMSPTGAQWAVHTAEHYPNILFEVGSMTASGGLWVSAICERLGADRIVYGSDLYVDPPSYFFPGVLYELLALPLPLGDKRAILGGNAMRLLG
jgi:predicted TIM-barrel fold metal-dependent hydrolase